ncbi:MAG: hypothetical protein IKK43_00680 [Clostridia bacterium]|nr:hypothetical protein [Clostridia bacterium]
MLIHERLSLTPCCANQKSYGLIRLSFPANPSTVKVSYMGMPVYPESFTLSGYPIFSEEMTDLYLWKDYQRLHHDIDDDNDATIFDVMYEKMEFNIPKYMFDSTDGIRKSLKSLAAFHEMLNHRKLWTLNNKEKKLKEFVVYGKYILDSLGQILLIKYFDCEYTMPDVCTLEYFRENVKTFGTTYHPPIPKSNSACPCCGKKFSISDLKKTDFGLVNGKIAHESCRKTYYHAKEINEMTSKLVDRVYGDCPDFDLLPNGYCNQNCCAHIPWFRFHTSDGDIIIGCRKRVISIEWQEDFKPFDMAIFNGENVTKWCENFSHIPTSINHGVLTTTGKRGIHAWGRENAIKYLKKVHNAVAKK